MCYDDNFNDSIFSEEDFVSHPYPCSSNHANYTTSNNQPQNSTMYTEQARLAPASMSTSSITNTEIDNNHQTQQTIYAPQPNTIQQPCYAPDLEQHKYEKNIRSMIKEKINGTKKRCLRNKNHLFTMN